jgi:hypothetical protein
MSFDHLTSDAMVYVSDSESKRAVVLLSGASSNGIAASDANANTRFRLVLQEDGTPQMALVDQNKNENLTLGLYDKTERPYIRESENGVTRVSIENTASGPASALLDNNGKVRVMSAIAKDYANFMLFDDKQRSA